MNYNDFQIDIRNLHVEWLRQPALREYWGTKYVEAVNERDHKKKQFEERKAEIEFEYRSNWEKLCPKIKLTEGSLTNVVTLHTDTMKLQDELLECNKNVNLISNVMKTLDDRKEALKNEVVLYTASYFDDHNIPDKVQEFVNEKSKEAINDDLKNNERIKKIRKKRSNK
jgi:hypothetical protein